MKQYPSLNIVKMKKRWRYYIDKEFQNEFVFKFSLIIILNAVLTSGLLWLIKEKSYNLLPENASVLVQVDTDKGVPISFLEGTPVLDEDNGSLFFPLKVNENKPPKLYNAFDLYLIPILATSILNLIVISLFSVFFSHKMAGPVKRIKNTLEAYAKHAPVHPIKLRKGDFFQDLAELINQALLRRTDKDV